MLLASVILCSSACESGDSPEGDLPEGSGCPVSTEVGPAPRLLATQVPSPAALALDASSVWFTAYSRGSIGYVDKLGASGPTAAIAGLVFPTGLAVDDAAVYFATAGGAVQRQSRSDGSLVELAAGQPRPEILWLDGDRLYWINRGTDGGHIHEPRPHHDAGLARVSTQGGPVEVLYTGEDEVSDLAIARGVAYLAAYHAERGSRILAIPLDGGSPSVLAEEAGALSGIAVHGDFVYWTRPLACAIRRMPIAGGSPQTIAAEENVPRRIAADEHGIVWSATGTLGDDFQGSEIVAADHDGAQRRVLAAARHGWALALTADNVYFTNNHEDGDVAAADRRRPSE